MSLSHSGQSIPERDCQYRGCGSSARTSELAEDAAGRNENIEAQCEREGEECQLSNDRHDTVEMAAIGTAFDNAVIGTGCD
jgi:hypothetical protein